MIRGNSILPSPSIPIPSPIALRTNGDSSLNEPSASRSTTNTATAAYPIRPRRRWPRIAGLVLILLVFLTLAGFLYERFTISRAMRANLPQLDGSLVVPGLSAPVTVQRDAQGVPHIRAASLDDLVFAQGYITAQDRLWQMDMLRRHAAGDLAAILGSSMLAHDRLQRTLQLRTAADNAFIALPADQKHWLEVYASGVNASIAAQHDRLPVEFRMLDYRPAPWAPRDSLLVELAMFEDLTTSIPTKLGRESLAAHLPPDLIADLYPVGSWRDHPPGAPIPDLTAPQPEIKDVPLDESQSRLREPSIRPTTSAADLLALTQTLAPFHSPCPECVAGSNAWAVSGAHTASGKPLVSNDMHLSLAVPSLWYEADLAVTNSSPAFHVAGVTLPGAPFVVVGHNDHVAWGFTNLGADVQDLYIEHTRGSPSGAQYLTATGQWLPIQYRREVIQVRGSSNVTLNVPLTRHGNTETPIVTAIFPGETRSLSLRWTVYDPANVTVPFFAVDSATDGASLLNAISTWGGPAQNMIYADDQGHIGYHAVGRIPIRGDINNPSPLSPVPTDAAGPGASSHEWVGYIPFDQLPQALDPPDGILATANARVTPDGYRYPITLDWMAPYRTERIYKVLESDAARDAAPGAAKLTPADMLSLQTDVYSELDQVIAQRLAYAIDHATGPLKSDKALHQAADILRSWNGRVDVGSPAPAIVNAEREAFWPMVLIPKLVPQLASQLAQGADLKKLHVSPEAAQVGNLWTVYSWGERDSVEEALITNTPSRWLPATYPNWNNFLAAILQRGLKDAHAPKDLNKFTWGSASPLDIQHPIFSRNRILQLLVGVPTGTGPQPHSGDGTTVKQMGRAFGPSERFTADLADPDHTSLNIVLGQSEDPVSPWFMDQFQDWLHGRTYPLPFTPAAVQPTTAHTLTLNPQ